MARSAAIETLINELIVALTQSHKTAATFSATKKRCEAILKDSSTWNRTDPFAVEKQLDGLQEKFRVLNKDDLADALGSRLSELEGQRSSWAPEYLSLLLQLSDRPADVSSVPKFETSNYDNASVQLKWSELDATGSEFADEDIWGDVDYGGASSDSESSIASSDISIPRILPQRAQPLKDEFVIPDELLTSGENDDLVKTIKSGHFWEYDSAAIREYAESHTRFITELQAAREILFMLQGLPTSLFWQIDNSIAVDRRYALSHVSNSAFLHMLRSSADIGVELGKLRKFVKIPQSVVFLQTFTRGVEKELAEFDVFLSRMQLGYLSPGKTVTVSLLQLTKEVQEEVRVLLLLADMVVKLGSAPPEQSFLCLDLLYNLVCVNQASGNEHEYKSLAKLFFTCFEAYARPLRVWLRSGDLETSQDNFFVTDCRHDHDLQTLWHDWYLLRETSGHLHAPIFIKPSARRILTTGKSMVFLQNLNVATDELESAHWQPLDFEAVCPDDTTWQLLPFSSLLDQAVENLISTNHILASSMLREQLNEQCGLWTSLSALQYIYLCKDASVSTTIDSKIFESLDNRGGVWNDRFLLTELVQSAFGDTDCVDTSRLIVRSARKNFQDFESQSRKVKILKSISIDYVLPWPVANIITKPAMSMYQRISTFLMQIRRAKYILERQRLLKKDDTGDDDEDEDDGLGYIIRHNLLWFTNILYGHVTDMVIATNAATMEKTLSESPDIDSMISVHESYMSALEEQCLLSPNLASIYQAVISLLDLCIYFADIQAARHGEGNRYDTSRSSTGLNGQHSKRRHRRRRTDDSSDSDDDDEHDVHEQDGEDNDYDEGMTSISFIESSYSHRLGHVMRQFHRSLAFVSAGLRGVGRVDGQQSWDILADRLSWNVQSNK
ncbi:hypothetical protein TCE0_018r05448 [Talaromyces pinophilus]|uniref:Spindle pole body component n=1 Tax=Talaromyces pinophilus TaxID=128442 RepID=A0A510NVW0_TALPI|nr:hypothetical protein TCE0_018r05448 [Talaromyces pinophilus]